MLAVTVYIPLDGALLATLATCQVPFSAVRSGIPEIVNQCPATIGEIPLLPPLSLPPWITKLAVVPFAEADTRTCWVPTVAPDTPADPVALALAVNVYSPVAGVFG